MGDQQSVQVRVPLERLTAEKSCTLPESKESRERSNEKFVFVSCFVCFCLYFHIFLVVVAVFLSHGETVVPTIESQGVTSELRYQWLNLFRCWFEEANR